MGSAGHLLVMAADVLETIDIRRPSLHGRQEIRSIQPPAGALGDLEMLPDDRRDRVDLPDAYGRTGPPSGGDRGYTTCPLFPHFLNIPQTVQR
jgi:hypothetical protein